MAKNRVVAYPREWLIVKLKKEAIKRECSVSELICSILFQYFNNK